MHYNILLENDLTIFFLYTLICPLILILAVDYHKIKINEWIGAKHNWIGQSRLLLEINKLL